MHIGTAWTRPEDDFVLIRQNMNNYMDKLKRMKQELEETKGALITSLRKCLQQEQTERGSLLEELVTSYILFDDPKVKFRSQLSWPTTAGSNLLGSLIEIYKTPRGRQVKLIGALKIATVYVLRLMFQRWKTWDMKMQDKLEEEGRKKRKENKRRLEAARKMQRAYRMYQKRQLRLLVSQIVSEIITNVMIDVHDQDLLDSMDNDDMLFSDSEEDEDDSSIDADDFM